MGIGYTKNEIMSLLDSHLQDVNTNMEAQITKMKQGSKITEVSLATLITSSMLSLLDAVSAVIEVNNKKINDDLKSQGKSKAKSKAKVKKTVAKAKPAAKANAKPAVKKSAGKVKVKAK